MISRVLNPLFVIGIILSTVACGGSDSKDKSAVKSKDSGSLDDVTVDDADEQGGKGGKAGGAAGKGGAGGTGGAGGDVSPSCPNNKLEEELGEVCDDGNYNNNDGCNSLCEYSCTEDDDCDDGRPCNGRETCNTENHKCQPGEKLKDHETCGPSMSCYSSECLLDACGDQWTKGTEECDDGNNINNDGRPANKNDYCTTKCKFTCVSTDPSRDCSALEYAQCGPPQVCNDTTHLCEVGASDTAVPEKATCNLNGVDGAGWCIGGQCVPTDCGDKEVGGIEECDKGDQNGVVDVNDLLPSGCTKDCKIQVCGNKKIEGTEECDDGNSNDLDSCDKYCESEFWYRYTSMNITKETAPEWCVFSPQKTGNQTSGGNQLGNAFAGSIEVPVVGKIAIVDSINYLLNDMLGVQCGVNVLNKVVDSDDLSFNTTDDSIGVAVYDGALELNETRCDPLDTRFSINVAENQDEKNPIVASFKTAQRTGMINSIEPSDIVSMVPGIGLVKLYKLMARIGIDASRSTPKAPPAVSEKVKRPERIGLNYVDPKPNVPAGRICAAVGVTSMQQLGVPKTLDGENGSIVALCCKANGTMFNQCDTNDVPGTDCDTFLDVMKSGCSVCMKSFATTAEGGSVPLCGSACDTAPVEIMKATEPDVEVDGEKAYSAVFAVEAVRVRVTGIR